MAAHRPHQGARPGRERDPLFNHLVDDAGRKSRQQRDALAQRRGKFDLATHGALRNGGDAGLLSDKVSEFVEAFLADHGGIHVGEEQALASSGGLLHHHINRSAAEGPTKGLGRDAIVVAVRRDKRDIERHAGIKPCGRPGSRQVPRRLPPGILRYGLRRMGEQGGDVGHGTLRAGMGGARDAMQDRMQQSEQDNVQDKVAVLIAGPTASGKSALAVALAERIGGVVVNTDSMQVYRDLRVITARPSGPEMARVPHLLYGHVDAAEDNSVGRILPDAGTSLESARAQGRMPIFTGGSGLYFKALTAGLAAIPPRPPEIRAAVRARLDASGPAALHVELSRRDPVAAAGLRAADRTPIARALEVVEATGRSITDWRHKGMPPLLDAARVGKIFLAPDRDALYRRIDARFDAMLSAGALDEVRALAARGLDPLLPSMKAHGVPWLMRHLPGEISLAAAVTEA